MKNLFRLPFAITLTILLLLSSGAEAQSFGITAGVGFGSIGDVRNVDLDQTTGFQAGLFAQLNAGPIGVRPAVLFVRAGDAVLLSAPDDPVTVEFVSVPVDLQLRIPLGIGAVYAGGGPDLRFPIQDGRPVFETRSVNLAASGVVGIQLASLFIEGRYALDVTGYAQEVGTAGSETDYRLNAIMVRAGVSF